MLSAYTLKHVNVYVYVFTLCLYWFVWFSITGGNGVRALNATVEDFNSTSARIRVNPMSSEDKDMLIGYVYRYKILPERNTSTNTNTNTNTNINTNINFTDTHQSRHGCGHDE